MNEIKIYNSNSSSNNAEKLILFRLLENWKIKGDNSGILELRRKVMMVYF